ncbi:MAG TPA: VOC family protein [Burkholderiaceae bacterium]|jgi:catechol 2,3-dioxygenase-like lactoylglutathione lyase family enzyme|nr:VOC family protein [Burkholderiaceae bacterium]
MIDHVSVGTRRYAEAVAFYRRVLAPLGIELLRDTGQEAAFGTAERWAFFLYPVPDGDPVTAQGMHIAFAAASRRQVAAVHDGAMAASGRDIFTPRTRPDINETYFGAMFHDLDGHRIEIKTDSPA